MKKLLFILIILLLIPLSVQADTDEILGISTYDEILGIGTSDEFLGITVYTAPACDADFCSDWNGVGADDESCTTTPCPDTWDSENGDSKIAVVSNALAFTADSTDEGWVEEDTDIAGWTEATFTWTVSLSGLDPNDDNGFINLVAARNGAAELLCVASLYHVEVGENIKVAARSYDYLDALSTDYEPSTGGLSLTVDTPYSMYVYMKKGTEGNTDGYCEVGIYDDSSTWKKAGEAAIRNYERWNDHADMDKIGAGSVYTTTLVNGVVFTIDDFKAYNSDQRP